MAAGVGIVDDEPLIRPAMVAVLDEVGHSAEGFEDAEALYTRLVAGEQPELLILDQLLPDEDGAQVVRSLRERPQYRDIPILFCTAVSDEDAERLADLAPVIRKPFDFREFVDFVEQLLPSRATSTGAPASRTSTGAAAKTDQSPAEASSREAEAPSTEPPSPDAPSA
jgi:DNA-binding response OmpR family regulator